MLASVGSSRFTSIVRGPKPSAKRSLFIFSSNLCSDTSRSGFGTSFLNGFVARSSWMMSGFCMGGCVLIDSQLMDFAQGDAEGSMATHEHIEVLSQLRWRGLLCSDGVLDTLKSQRLAQRQRGRISSLKHVQGFSLRPGSSPGSGQDRGLFL
jgi:hypothetical protein